MMVACRDDVSRCARNALQACCLVVAVLASPAHGQQQQSVPATESAPDVEMKYPRLSFATVDWDAARAKLAVLDQAALHDAPAGTAAPDAFALLNGASEKFLPKISAIPLPVLLPFDPASLLHDQAQGAPGDPGKYFAGFGAPTLFFAGPSGYDAGFSLQPQNFSGLGLSFERRVDILITGSTLTYDLDPPALSEQSPVPELTADFPDIRRVLLEERLRYAFTRFGVPYVVSMLCFDGANSAHRLSCRDADKVAVRFIKALAIAGGTPRPDTVPVAALTIDRPRAVSPDFTYYAPGDLLPGTGMKGQGGRADATVYAKIRYPMAQAPSYINSQSFMNWGDCNFTGRVGLHGDGKAEAYRCRVNSIPLLDDESKNYVYPWRDNFCEHRDYYVGQCPAGLGHQGEDIRPGSCLFRIEDADRCEPFQHDLVAVRDGMVMRNPGDEALYLVVNAPGEHIRFRYLHMSPQMLDAAGLVNGRVVSEGEVLGAVDNYQRSQAGTSYHLHFNVQVFTRDGWVFVSPYMTLVASYERLIGGRGRVVRDTVATTASLPPSPDGQPANHAPTPQSDATPISTAPSAIVAPKNSESAVEEKTVSAESCETRFVKGHRRRFCEPDRAASRERKGNAVRSVDRDVSR